MNVCAESSKTSSPVPLNSYISHFATTTVGVGSGGIKKRKFRGLSQKTEKNRTFRLSSNGMRCMILMRCSYLLIATSSYEH